MRYGKEVDKIRRDKKTYIWCPNGNQHYVCYIIQFNRDTRPVIQKSFMAIRFKGEDKLKLLEIDGSLSYFKFIYGLDGVGLWNTVNLKQIADSLDQHGEYETLTEAVEMARVLNKF